MRLRSKNTGVSGGVFVTVGTTSFDALVEAVDDPAFVAAALKKGFTSLTIQARLSLGRGTYVPTRIVPAGETTCTRGGFTTSWFRYAPDLSTHVCSAGLVVCHAGAGSVFEALQAQRAVLVVVNEALMDNHQVELADALAQEGHLAYCVPSGLVSALRVLQPEALTPYVPGSAAPVARAIDELCGFK